MRRALAWGLGALLLLGLLGLGALAWVGQGAAVTLVTPALLREAAAGARPLAATGLEGLPVEEVTVDLPLGPATALWVRAEPRPGARPLAALFVHGIGGRAEDGAPWAAALHRRGVSVLLLRYRNDEGAPAAPDGRYGVGTTEWEDAAAGLDWLRARGEGRILFIGASMGGAIVGQLVRRPERLEGVVALALDAPAVDGPATLAFLLGRAGIPLPGLAAALGTQVAARRTGVDLPGARVAGALAASPLPLLLLHGAGDRVVPVAGSDALAARRAAPTIYLRTTGDHLTAWASDPALVEGALDGLLAALR